jgi:hypothetical protein
MSRDIHSSTVSALASDSLRMATLVEFDFYSPIRITDWGFSLSALNLTWNASAEFIGVSEITETAELRVNSATITLSGVDQSYISVFLNNQYHGVQAKVWKVVLDSAANVIGDPILAFDGNIDGFSLDESDDQSTVEISVASHWANFEMTSGRKTNHNSQQLYFPGDLGFEFAPDTVEDIKWGRT